MRGTVGVSRIAWALLLAMLVIGRPVVADEAPTLTTGLAEADRLLAAGELRQAQSMLEVLQAQLPPDAPPEQRAAVSARLGAVLGETGEDEQARALLQDAVELASSSGQPGLQAEALNDLGNVQLRADAPAALASYRASATLAESTRLPRLRVRALVNAARAETLGEDGLAMTMARTVEEVMEMSGLIIFIWTLHGFLPGASGRVEAKQGGASEGRGDGSQALPLVPTQAPPAAPRR